MRGVFVDELVLGKFRKIMDVFGKRLASYRVI